MLDVEEEFESLAAIYPEIQLDPESRSGKLLIPVALEALLKVQMAETETCHEIANLSPIELAFSLPERYPHQEPPDIRLEGCQWLDPVSKESILAELTGIWQDFQDIVLFSVIDYLKEHSQNAFGTLDFTQPLVLPKQTYLQFLEADARAKQLEFNLQTFTCEICQNDKKGESLQKFELCGHIFCNQCLKEYFTSNIQRGELENIHCPSFECTKVFVETNNRLSRGMIDQDIHKFETEFFQLPLSKEFLDRIIDPTLTERYLKLITSYKFEKYKRLFPIGRSWNCSLSKLLSADPTVRWMQQNDMYPLSNLLLQPLRGHVAKNGPILSLQYPYK
ncbi:hypothetical protein KL906_001368 [Ogataea polymorpha]|nr:hypothetical protein KL906_001368 [Ogataea polymorpha]